MKVEGGRLAIYTQVIFNCKIEFLYMEIYGES